MNKLLRQSKSNGTDKLKSTTFVVKNLKPIKNFSNVKSYVNIKSYTYLP